MDFDADVAAVVIAQKSPHPRLDRAACVMIRMHNLRLFGQVETDQWRGRGANDLGVQLRRRAFDQLCYIGGPSGGFRADRRLHGECSFVNEEPEAHRLRHDDNTQHQE